MSNENRVKLASDIILPWLTVVSLILGGLWAALEYDERNNSRISDKAAQVLVFVERYNRKPIQEYRNNKVKALAKAYRDSYKKSSNQIPDDCAIQKSAVEKFGLRFEIDNVTFFYDELFVCVNSGICDENIAHSFFGKHAFDFMWGLQCYIPFVKEARERRNVSGYAEGLIHFASMYEDGTLIKKRQ
jgi:hypothetical protein